MTNNNLHIDDLFLRGLGGYTEVPPAAVWNSLEQRLDKNKGKINPLGWWWILLILLTVAGGAYYGKDIVSLFSNNAKNTTSDKITTNETKTTQSSATPIQQPATTGNTTTNANETIATNTNTKNQPVTTTNSYSSEKNSVTTTTNNKETNTKTGTVLSVTEKRSTEVVSQKETKPKHINKHKQTSDNTTTAALPNLNTSAATTDIPNDNTKIEKKEKQKPKQEATTTTTAVATHVKDTTQTTVTKKIDVSKKTTKQKNVSAPINIYSATTNSRKKPEKIATAKNTNTTSVPIKENNTDNTITNNTEKKDKDLTTTNKTEKTTNKQNNDSTIALTDKKTVTTKTSDPNQDKTTTLPPVADKKEKITQDKTLDKKIKDNDNNISSNTTGKPSGQNNTTNKKTSTTNTGIVKNNILADGQTNKNMPPQTVKNINNNSSSKPGSSNPVNLSGVNDKPNSMDKNKNRMFYDVGVKAAYSLGTQAFSINSLVLSGYFQLHLSKKISIQVEPGFKINGTGGGPFKQPETFISPYTTIIDTSSNGGWNVSHYTHLFDSITKKHSLDAGRTTETELPILIKFKASNNLYVFAGPVFTFGSIVAITTTTDSVHGGPIQGKDSVSAPGYLSAANVYIKYHTSPLYSTYDPSQYQNPSSTTMRVGLMLGLNYNPDDRLGIYFSLQPNITDLNFIPNNTIRSLYSQTYIRVGVSYMLFGSK